MADTMTNELKNLFRPQKGIELNFCKLCANSNLMHWLSPCRDCVYLAEYKAPEQTAKYHSQWKAAVGTEYSEARAYEQAGYPEREVEQIDNSTEEVDQEGIRPAPDILDPRTGQPMCFV